MFTSAAAATSSVPADDVVSGGNFYDRVSQALSSGSPWPTFIASENDIGVTNYALVNNVTSRFTNNAVKSRAYNCTCANISDKNEGDETNNYDNELYLI